MKRKNKILYEETEIDNETVKNSKKCLRKKKLVFRDEKLYTSLYITTLCSDVQFLF